MEYIIRHQLRNIPDYYVTNLFKNLINGLTNKYPEHTFKVEHNPEYEKFGYGSIYSCMHLSIVNPNNEQYILVSLFDNWRHHFMKHLGWKPHNMKQFFYAGGFNYFDYYRYKILSNGNPDVDFPENIETIYNHFYYNMYHDCCENDINDIFNNQKTTNNSLIFRGWMWDNRKLMTNELNSNDIIVVDRNLHNENKRFIDYLRELKTYSAALSLPGGTEICNRDIECFAIGVPVIRPLLTINYPDPLIPNYHYINCYHSADYSTDGNPHYLNYNDFKENLINVWNNVKNNQEYLNFVAKNAKEWYEKHCKMQQNIDLLLNKINLNLI